MTQHQSKVAVVQASPVYLDLGGTVDKAITLMDEASAAGADLVAFPETWIPGYPWWIWLGSPLWGMQFVSRYHANALVRDSEEERKLCAAARRNQIHVVLGCAERIGGSLYMAQWLIDNNGEIVARRRKLRPTHVERSVFGEGDGSDLNVHDTSIGRLGMLNCWEHIQPLTKYAMYSMHEQIHVASWPSFSVYNNQFYQFGPEFNSLASQMYSVEGQCFTLAAYGTISEDMLDLLCDTPDKRELLQAGGGYAQIYGPDGAPMVEPMSPTEEGLLYAEIDLNLISLAKSVADPVGHYARSDVTRLVLNREPSTPLSVVSTTNPEGHQPASALDHRDTADGDNAGQPQTNGTSGN